MEYASCLWQYGKEMNKLQSIASEDLHTRNLSQFQSIRSATPCTYHMKDKINVNKRRASFDSPNIPTRLCSRWASLIRNQGLFHGTVVNISSIQFYTERTTTTHPRKHMCYSTHLIILIELKRLGYGRNICLQRKTFVVSKIIVLFRPSTNVLKMQAVRIVQ